MGAADELPSSTTPLTAVPTYGSAQGIGNAAAPAHTSAPAMPPYTQLPNPNGGVYYSPPVPPSPAYAPGYQSYQPMNVYAQPYHQGVYYATGGPGFGPQQPPHQSAYLVQEGNDDGETVGAAVVLFLGFFCCCVWPIALLYVDRSRTSQNLSPPRVFHTPSHTHTHHPSSSRSCRWNKSENRTANVLAKVSLALFLITTIIFVVLIIFWAIALASAAHGTYSPYH